MNLALPEVDLTSLFSVKVEYEQSALTSVVEYLIKTAKNQEKAYSEMKDKLSLLDELDQRVTKVEKDKIQTDSTIATLFKSIQSQSDKLGSIETKQNDIKEHSVEQDNKIRDLEKSAAVAADSITKMQDDAAAKADRIQVNEDKIEGLQANIANINKINDDFFKKIEKLNEDTAELKDNQREILMTNARLSKETAVIDKKVVENTADIDSLASRATNLETLESKVINFQKIIEEKLGFIEEESSKFKEEILNKFEKITNSINEYPGLFDSLEEKIREMSLTINKLIKKQSQMVRQVSKAEKVQENSPEDKEEENEEIKEIEFKVSEPRVAVQFDDSEVKNEIAALRKQVFDNNLIAKRQFTDLEKDIEAVYDEISRQVENISMPLESEDRSLSPVKGPIRVEEEDKPKPKTENKGGMSKIGLKKQVDGMLKEVKESLLELQTKLVELETGREDYVKTEDFSKIKEGLTKDIKAISTETKDSASTNAAKIEDLNRRLINATTAFEKNKVDDAFIESLFGSLREEMKSYTSWSDSIFNCLGKNEGFSSRFNLVERNAGEINKIYESIVEIRRLFIDNKPEDNANSKIEEVLNRTIDNSVRIANLKRMFEENVKMLSVDEEAVEGEEKAGDTVKPVFYYINNLTSELNEANNKIAKMKKKVDGFNSDVLSKIKSEIEFQSVKMMDEMKSSWRVSIQRVEEQLKFKVDKLNLEEFAVAFNKKFFEEIAKKLDKVDLVKTNTKINRKINTLENKIGRTLVDTLIDLQMEEIPLLMKQSVGTSGEKCASCGQLICKTNHKKTKSVDARPKIRTIADNSMKYGTGGYSRHLSNIQADQFTDMRKSEQKTSRLPKIPGSKGTDDFVFERDDKVLSEMLDKEIQKTNVNGKKIINMVDRFHANKT